MSRKPTFVDYLAEVEDFYLSFPTLEWGPCYYTVLMALRADLGDQIAGTVLDPYLKQPFQLEPTLKWLEENW